MYIGVRISIKYTGVCFSFNLGLHDIQVKGHQNSTVIILLLVRISRKVQKLYHQSPETVLSQGKSEHFLSSQPENFRSSVLFSAGHQKRLESKLRIDILSGLETMEVSRFYIVYILEVMRNFVTICSDKKEN